MAGLYWPFWAILAGQGRLPAACSEGPESLLVLGLGPAGPPPAGRLTLHLPA